MLTTDYSISAFIGLGSNLGDRAGNLLLALREMLNVGLPIVRLSSVYETAPVDVVLQQPMFLNMVAELKGKLPSPEELLDQLMRIELSLGRRRERPRDARTIDLDLLLYGLEERESDFLVLPHPRLHLRRFVLTPLVELAPHGIHPKLNKTFVELLVATEDDSPVKIWQPQ